MTEIVMALGYFTLGGLLLFVVLPLITLMVIAIVAAVLGK